MSGDAGGRRFTSWKLDVLNALSVDPDATDLDFRVAYRIMQHVNCVSRIAWPSVARLAAQLGKSEDRIRASTRRLQEIGWILKRRKSQKGPNEYCFLLDRQNPVIDAMVRRVEEIGTGDDHAEMHGQKSDDHADLHGPDHVEMHGPDHADLHGKHLNQNYLHGTPSDPGREEEGPKVSSVPRYGSDKLDEKHIPFTVPETDEEVEELVMAWLEGQPPNHVMMLFDELRARLSSGTFTPAELETMLRRAA